jgi:hypothetical protein
MFRPFWPVLLDLILLIHLFRTVRTFVLETAITIPSLGV